MLKVKIALGATLAVLLLVGWYRIEALQADKARLEQSAALAQTESAALRLELTANHTALMQREQIQAELIAETERLRNELEELYQNNEPCAAWSVSPVPGPIIDRLRK